MCVAHLVFPPNIRETWCRNIKGERRDKTANVFEKRSHQEEIYARRGDKFSRWIPLRYVELVRARAWISRCLLKHPLRNPLKSIRRKFAEVVDLRRSIETRLKFRKRNRWERKRERDSEFYIYFVVYKGFILNTFLIFFHGIKIKLRLKD